MTLATVLFLADVVVQLVPNELLYHPFCTLFKVLETFMQQHLHCRLQMHLPFEEKFNLEQDTSFENLLVIYLNLVIRHHCVSLVFIFNLKCVKLLIDLIFIGHDQIRISDLSCFQELLFTFCFVVMFLVLRELHSYSISISILKIMNSIHHSLCQHLILKYH